MFYGQKINGNERSSGTLNGRHISEDKTVAFNVNRHFDRAASLKVD